MCKFSSKSGGVPFQPLGDLTWNDPEWTKHIDVITSKANSKLSFLRRNLKGCPEKLRETVDKHCCSYLLMIN